MWYEGRSAQARRIVSAFLKAVSRVGGKAIATAAVACLGATAAQAQLIISDLPDSPDPVPAGGMVTYTVRVAETNGTPLSDGSFRFSIPANGIYAGSAALPAGVSCTGMAAGQPGPGLLTCSGISMAANETVQVPLRVRSVAQGTLSVTATPSPGGSAQTELTTVNAGADLALSLSGPATAPAGSTQTLQFTVTNNGPDASPGSVLSYSVPPGFSPTSTPPGCSLSGSVLSCSLGSIAVGGSRAVSLTGVIGAGGGSTVTHAADVAAGGGVADGVSDNNTASFNTAVTAGSAVSIGKTKSVADPVFTGTRFNFVLHPRYSGDYPVGAQVQDNLPAPFCYAGSSTSFSSNGWSCTATSSCPSAGPSVSCTQDGAGVAGANVSMGQIVIPVQAISTGPGVINTATITAPGATSANGSVATTVADPLSDLRANKSRSWPQSAVPLNQPFNYSVSTTNLGPTAFPASGVITLTDTVPAGLQVNSVSPPAGFSCSSSGGASYPQAGPVTIVCTSSGVTLGVNATTPAITLNAQATVAGAVLTNQVCNSSTGGPVDNQAANDCASVSVTPQDMAEQAQLSTLKRVLGIGDSALNRQLAGQPVTWEIEVVNAGPATATDVAVTDVFNNVYNAAPGDYSLATVPGAATFGSCALAAGASNVSLSNCRIASLPVCTAAVDCPRIRVTVRHFGNGTTASNDFQVNNTAFALAQDQGDGNLSNNTSPTATAYFLARADVTVTKADNPDPVPAGQQLTYTITASNPAATSASTAFDVTINDTLPEGLVFLSATPSGAGSCSQTPGVGATTTAANKTLLCTWPSISRGGQQTVSVRVRPLAALSTAGGGSGSITNSVTVSTSTPEVAGGENNNSATQATAVVAPSYDLLVNKTDDADPVNVGDDVTYTLTVTSNRASTAENVVLTDTLPTGAGAPTFVEVVQPLPAGVTCSTPGASVGAAGGTVRCLIAQLGGTGSGSTGETASVQVRIRLRGADKGQYTNQASVGFADSSMDALDALPGNNIASQPTTFRLKADVQVVSKQAVRAGTVTPLASAASSQAFDWLVLVRNNGPQAAEITTFTDNLPAGLVLAGAPSFSVTAGTFSPAAPACSGASGGTAVSCAIASMPAGGTATVRIPVRFSGTPANGSSFTNTASIVTTGSGDTNGGADPNAGNNFSSGAITAQTASLSGRVYHDLNGNGQPDPGEPGLATTINLTGTDDAGEPVTRSVMSDAATGAYSFLLPAGTYTLVETQPAGFLPGITRAGTVSGAGSSAGSVPTGGAGVSSGPRGSNANVIQTVVLGAAGMSVNNLFGEVRASSIAGRVYHDGDYNGVAGAGEPGIAGTAVALSGTDLFGNAVSLTTTSAAATGSYSFGSLFPGQYTVAEGSQPAGYVDGTDSVGTAGGSAAANDRVSGIELGSNVQATGYDFGEQLTRVQVRVFEDGNNDGSVQPGEAGITGVALRLTGTDANGRPVDIAAVPVAGQPGRYEFPNVPPSSAAGYTITETQPATYAPGKASANGHPGVAQPGGNVITGVTVPTSGAPATLGDYLFGELTSGQVRGRAYYDVDGDGSQRSSGEPGLAGVVVRLSGTDDNGNAVDVATTTDGNGDYVFNNVAPGSYTVTQTRPGGYLPGLTRAGSVTGAGSVAGSVPSSGTGVTAGPRGSNANAITGIRLGSVGASSSSNNFSSVRAASLAGLVYADIAPSNGGRDAGEPGIAGVSVTLSGTDLYGHAVTRVLTTAPDGSFGAADLLPGTYQLDEAQPSGLADGSERVGQVAGTPRGSANPAGADDRIGGIVLASEESGIDYLFGELGGQLSGLVYVDANGDGTRSTGERGVPGVTVRLTGTTRDGAAVNRTAVTDADGRYVFDGLLPSDTAGYTLTETQPPTYADGLDAAGTVAGITRGVAGNDVISGIVYGGGQGENYLFGERGASLSGQVYNDANGNGVREPGDLPIRGVVITLSGTDATGRPVSRTVTTGPDGSYRFDDLPVSDSNGYTLTETQPPGYDSVGEKPGTLGGSVPASNQIRVPITVAAAQGTGYDFFERSRTPAAITGTVWRDADHDRARAGGEPVLAGWTAELVGCADGSTSCAMGDSNVLAVATTAADGSYRLDHLVPGDYRVRFRSPSGQLVGGAWPTDPVHNGAGGPHPTVSGTSPRAWIAVSPAAGTTVVNQDLPLDPGGIVYDSLSAQPVAGASVALQGPTGFDPQRHLLGGAASSVTAADGAYQFFLLPGAPAGEYRLEVTPPAAYVNSLTYPPAAGPLNAGSCSAPSGFADANAAEPCVVSPGLPQAGALPPYFLWLQVPVGGAQNVVNNHIPLDPQGTGSAIELRKTTSKLTVKKGELVPYVITARNTRAVGLANVVLVDTLPPGFKYVGGSLTVQRLPTGAVETVVPQLEGRRLSLPARSFAANESHKVSMVLGVGTGVGEGEYLNQVVATQGAGGNALSNVATATVRVVPDALFDCTDVIGKVYDDKNANGYQEDGEPGLAGVRLATVNGLLVQTDAQGRYHLACAAVPKEGTGSNFVLKLDERTLPSGYRVTSENPASERLTRGKVVKINFGATVHRVVRLDLRADAFEAGSQALKPEFTAQLGRVIDALVQRPSVLRLAYRPAAGEAQGLADARIAALKADLFERWRRQGAAQARALFNLDIEVERVPASVTP
ncbi:SdrD B-like domain-containing protein [Eleftheria terrae]|uniref:SdrD B-like domain-containing protein n=1 Tax=Eleftheria terrae TaxID=1597781 RepID=UPI00263B3FDE|nr:SdrD B-like domain-containing protein [Eleftheria terrae]WKB56153.1 hypothetical protein N7L95_29365 [Eleftheria terrae]